MNALSLITKGFITAKEFIEGAKEVMIPVETITVDVTVDSIMVDVTVDSIMVDVTVC